MKIKILLQTLALVTLFSCSEGGSDGSSQSDKEEAEQQVDRDYLAAIGAMEKMKKEAQDLDVAGIKGAEDYKKDAIERIEELQIKLGTQQGGQEACDEADKLEDNLEQIDSAIVVAEAQGLLNEEEDLATRRENMGQHLKELQAALFCK